jgi:hypothetical protein
MNEIFRLNLYSGFVHGNIRGAPSYCQAWGSNVNKGRNNLLVFNHIFIPSIDLTSFLQFFFIVINFTPKEKNNFELYQTCTLMVLCLPQQYERFFQPEATVVATVFAPIMFPPASVLAFKEKKDGSQVNLFSNFDLLVICNIFSMIPYQNFHCVLLEVILSSSGSFAHTCGSLFVD